MKNWFILSEEQVIGPFSTEDVQSRLSSLKNPQVWGRGFTEWMTPDKWQQEIQGRPTTKTPPTWKLRIEGSVRPAMAYQEMLTYLRTLKDYSMVDVFVEKTQEWRELYAVQQIVDDLGISRRSHPRVPITGHLECELPNGLFSCRVISISQGGLGVTDITYLQIGQNFKATLDSPNLYVRIHCSCEVVYVGADGYAGLQFTSLTDESKGAILEYVNKFAT